MEHFIDEQILLSPSNHEAATSGTTIANVVFVVRIHVHIS